MRSEISRINNVCLVILAIVALTGALIYTKPVLVPLVFALFTYSAILPLIKWLEKSLKFPRWLALLVSVLGLSLAAALFTLILVTSINDFIEGFDLYREKFFILSAEVLGFLRGYGIFIDQAWLKEELSQLPMFTVAKGLTGAVVGFVGNFTLIALFVLFMIVGQTAKKTRSPFVEEIQHKISHYLLAKGLVSMATGIFTFVVLMLFDVELAFMFSVVTVLLNFIPNIGSIVATFIPLPVVILQFGFGWELPTILALLGVIQFTIGNILEPKILGDSMDLHPVAVMAFLIFWGLVWGTSGLFLAVPITAIIKIVMSKIETTRPVAEILGGRLSALGEE